MNKCILLATLVLVSVLSEAAATHSYGDWVRFLSPNKAFEMLFPVEPEHQTEVIEKAAGKITTDLWTAKYENGIFIAGFTDYPIDLDPKTELDLDVVNFMKESGGKLTSQSDIIIDGRTIRQFAGKAEGFKLGGRVFMDGRRRTYLIAGAIPESADAALVTKFADSFKLRISATAK